MSKVSAQPSSDDFSRVVDQLVEHGIKLEAMQQVFRETNPLVHELYLGAIDDLRAQKTAELKRILTLGLESKLRGD